MFELLSYFDFSTTMSICLQVIKNSIYFSILSHFMAINFSVVSLYNFEETCVILESPFHAELN